LALLPKVNIASVAMIPKAKLQSSKLENERKATRQQHHRSSQPSLWSGQLDPSVAFNATFRHQDSSRINLQDGHQA
jgi:hypothetical protein